MNEPTYPTARAVSAAVRTHFSSCIAAARARGEREAAPEPDERTVEQITSAGFWASLRREEGRSPKISLAYVPPDRADDPLVLRTRMALEPGLLAKLAPAVERPGIHLGVWHDEGQLYVWGATRSIPPCCFVLEVIEPGLLVIKRRRGREGAKYANVAVLQGDQLKLVDEHGGDLPGGLPIIASLLGFASPRTWTDPVNVVVQIALSMRAHGRGGLLLIVPHGSRSWLQSIVQPVSYPVDPPFNGLSRLLEQEDAGRPEWVEAVRRAVEAVAGLTAVDGAAVITDRHQVVAFGAKIGRAPSGTVLDRVVVVEPVVGSRAATLDPSQLGGTRHLSAAQFVQDQPDAVALVASQDGRFTVFGLPPGEATVHAHRVEALLI